MDVFLQIFVLALAIEVKLSVQQTIQNAKDLETLLFTTNSYNKKVRPTSDQSQAVTVSLELNLLSVDNFDMAEQTLTTSAYLSVTWTDSELTWTSASYGGISELFLPQGDIWKPDIILDNGVSGMTELGDTSLLVNIQSDGTVKWQPYESFKSKCSINTYYYPFDEQVCALKFTGWSTNVAHVKFITDNNAFNAGQLEENGEWVLLSTSASNETSGTESSVSFELKLSRRPMLIMVNVIIPILYLGIINCYLFILPIESGEKIGYAVTLFLSLAVFLTLISDNLPQNATKLPAITVYLTARALLGTLSVAATITQLNLYHREDSEPIPSFLRFCHNISSKMKNCIVGTMCCCCCHKDKNTKIEPDESETGKNEKTSDEKATVEILDWKTLTSSLDFLFLVLFLTAEMIFAMFFFMVAPMHLPY